MINKETRQNHPTSEIITENERQLKQLQEWATYGEEFFNGENSEKNISDKTIAIKYIEKYILNISSFYIFLFDF